MSNTRIKVLAVVALLTLSAGGATQAARMTMQCQQNVEDHRTLVANGNMLPENSTYKIVSYKPVRRENGWTYGPCILNVTPDKVD